LRQAQHACEAFVDAHAEDWTDEQLAREADIVGDACCYYASSLEGEAIGGGPTRRPVEPGSLAVELAHEQMIAALYAAVDSCCELVARHPCGAENCHACTQADRAAGYLLAAAELSSQALAAVPYRIQSRSARRRAALASHAVLPHTAAAIAAA
jgi:hypothetical protein